MNPEGHIQQYTCTYQDKDTHRTWKLHLLDTPLLNSDSESYSDRETMLDFYRHLRGITFDPSLLSLPPLRNGRKRPSGIIYCHNINEPKLASLSSGTIRIFKEHLGGDLAMKSIILCTTEWNALVDKSVGQNREEELKDNHWDLVLDLGARLARHNNTRKSVEEILGLILGKEAVQVLLLKELGRPEIKQNDQRTKQLVQEIRSMEIKEATHRAQVRREGEEHRWKNKLENIFAELGRAKTAEENWTIGQKIRRERENQEWKMRMWETIQRAREERIDKATPVLCGSLVGVPSVKLILNPACAASDKVSDTTTVIPNSRVDDHVVGGANDKNGDNFVPLQFKPFTGEYSRYAISPELASKKFECVDLLLDTLNGIFDTNIPISYPGIQKTLEYLINKGHDFGVIYAYLQAIWPKLGMPLISSNPFADDTNSDYVIGSPELAARKCQDFEELLSFLNMSFDTDITLSKSGIEKVLRFLVNGGYKFGDICAHMRYTWPSTQKRDQQWLKAWYPERMNLEVWGDFLILEERGEHHEDQRQNSLRDDAIHNLSKIQPRRIWDLFAHRVIPFQFSLVDANRYNRHQMMSKSSVTARLYLGFGPTRVVCYHPVSHSWTEDMSPVDSPVNAHEWPIPLPHGVTLEAVRNELLNLGAQYVWLDVVCLRQESSDPKREALRINEWKIDVPTIGRVYQSGPSVDNVIRYFNGLGRAFRRHGWHDKRHWSQRAWTLQEVGSGNYIEAGLPNGVENPLEETDGNGLRLLDHLKTGEIRLHFHPRIGYRGTDLHNAIAAMKGRHSQNPTDKVFGLSAILDCTALPTYSKDEQVEQAWARLLRHVDARIVAQLLFACPLPGENGCYWRPSWRQLMEDTMIEKVSLLGLMSVKFDEGGRLSCFATLIKGCQISPGCRSVDTVVVRTERGDDKYEWTMIKPHTEVILPGEYTLAGHDRHHWVLCKPHPSGELEKVSVLCRSPGSDIIKIGLTSVQTVQFLPRSLMYDVLSVVFC